MAKTSKIVKNNKRRVIIDRYAERRAELVKVIKDPKASYEDKREAYQKIAKMPRDASATRYRNRCGARGQTNGRRRDNRIPPNPKGDASNRARDRRGRGRRHQD